MDYAELAKQFLNNSYRLRGRNHQKKIDEVMRGETFAILYISKRNDMVLPSEVSNKMNISSARVTVILNSLENKGLITRQIDKSDRRQILISLTQKGAELAEKHDQMVLDMTARMLELLGEHDAKELVRITGKLAKLAPKIQSGE